MEETSTVFLDDQVDRALDALRALDDALPSDVRSRVGTDIQRLHVALTQLQYYYLPMLQAREQAYNAYRFYHLGRADKTREHLHETELLLEGIAGHGDTVLKVEMERLADQVFLVEEALRLRPSLVSGRFRELIRSLNLKALRGGLILNSRDLKGEDN